RNRSSSTKKDFESSPDGHATRTASMNERLFSTEEMSIVTGINRWAMRSEIQGGHFSPTRTGTSQGKRHRFSMVDVLAVTIGHDLKQRGVPIKQARKAVIWLAHQTLPELRRHWSVRRNILLLAGTLEPFYRLLTQEEVQVAISVVKSAKSSYRMV